MLLITGQPHPQQTNIGAKCLKRLSHKSHLLYSTGWRKESKQAIQQLMRILTVSVFAVLVLVWMNGCGSRTVFIPEDSPIRLGPNTKTRVYTLQQGEWVLSNHQVGLPEGWYCVPPSYVSERDPLPSKNK